MALGNDSVINEHIKQRELEDVQGAQTQKIYLYTVENFKDRGFIKEQAVSILQIKPLDTPICMRATGHNDLAQITISNNTKGSSVKYENRPTQYGYTTIRDFNSINKDNKILIATLKQLSISNSGKPNTEIFMVQHVVSAFINPIKTPEEEFYNPTDFQLILMKDVVSNYQNLLVLYTFLNIYKKINEINLTLQNYSYFNKIMARGLVSNKPIETDVKLKINSVDTNFSLLNLSPASTNYKISWYSHWLDANRTLAYIKAKLFVGTGAELKKVIFNDLNGDFKPWSSKQIEDAYAVVFNMIKMTQGFASNFKDYRTKGVIDQDAEIGGVSLIDIVGKPAIVSVDGVLESFVQRYPESIHDSGYKILMEVLTMLGRYINSTKLIGKGINRYNEVFLPWTFILETTINKSVPATKDIKVKLASKYFDINGTSSDLIALPQYFEISNYQVFDIGGWISEAELPNIIRPLNSFSNIGDVPTTNDNPIKYLFMVPYRNQEKLEHLYGSLETKKHSGWHPEKGTRYYRSSVLYASDWLKFNEIIPKPPDIKNINLETYINFAANEKLVAGSISAGIIFNIVKEKQTRWSYSGGRYPVPVATLYYRYSYQISFSYRLLINGTQTITTTQHRGQIFDKGDFQSISNTIMDGADTYNLSLLPIHTIGNKETGEIVNKLNEINIQGINLDMIGINISFEDDKGKTIQLFLENILLPSHYDEVLTNLTILL